MKQISRQAKEVLAAREKRYIEKQQFIQAAPELTYIESSMNIPGVPKVGSRWHKVFETGLYELEKRLAISQGIRKVDDAGYYALHSSDVEVCEAKRVCCEIESQAPWGRLLDLDCIGPKGRVSRQHLGFSDRLCMVCHGPQSICLRDKSHRLEQARAAANRLAKKLSLN